ncbi:polycystin cation channel protein, partial [Cystoisospora suis]
SEIPRQVLDCLADFVFCCTPDPSSKATYDEALRLQREAEAYEKEQKEENLRRRLEEKRGVKIFHLAEDKVRAYRWLLLLLSLFVMFFLGGISLLIDAPKVFRDHTASQSIANEPFVSTDPIISKELLKTSPPLWFTPNTCQRGDTSSSSSAGASTVPSIPTTLPEPLQHTVTLSDVCTIQGIYDWLEQVLSSRVLNAASSAPYLSPRSPLANPGALLEVTRVQISCRTSGGNARKREMKKEVSSFLCSIVRKM